MANNKFFCETFLKSGNSYAKKRDLENLLLYKKKEPLKNFFWKLGNLGNLLKSKFTKTFNFQYNFFFKKLPSKIKPINLFKYGSRKKRIQRFLSL